jgi:hypothetical protein
MNPLVRFLPGIAVLLTLGIEANAQSCSSCHSEERIFLDPTYKNTGLIFSGGSNSSGVCRVLGYEKSAGKVETDYREVQEHELAIQVNGGGSISQINVPLVPYSPRLSVIREITCTQKLSAPIQLDEALILSPSLTYNSVTYSIMDASSLDVYCRWVGFRGASAKASRRTTYSRKVYLVDGAADSFVASDGQTVAVVCVGRKWFRIKPILFL